MSRHVLIIGIDGGTWSILRPAMTEGHMPYLRELIEQGSSGTLLSTIPPRTCPAWSSFQTGFNPGRTGIFDFASWDKENKTPVWVSSKMLPETIWDIASQAGKKVACVNVPMTYPPKAINGFMVTGILTPSIKSNFTYPNTLKKELLRAVPDYHIFKLNPSKKYSPHEDLASYIENMVDVLKNRSRAACYIIDKDPEVDLFMVHFQASDVIQHALWGYLTPGNPLYSTEKRTYILKNFYRELDRKIQEVREHFIKKVSGDLTTFVISDHGFQIHRNRFFLGNWLVSQGLLQVREDKTHPLLKTLRTLDFLKVRNILSKRKTGQTIIRALKIPDSPFLWEKSRVYSFSRSGDGFVFLLEKDESARRKTETELRKKLHNILDPETNKPIVEKIYSQKEIYQGDKLNLLPDLIVRPMPGYSFTGNFSKTQKTLFHRVNKENDYHLGLHHMEGILVAHGDQIKKQYSTSNAQLIDMAPTILACLGIPVPEGMDGKILQDLFHHNLDAQYVASSHCPKKEHDEVYSNDDIKNLQERLKNLGYLE